MFPRVICGRGSGLGEPLGRSGGVGLHAGQQVLVGLHRERDVGVSEPLGHDLDRDPVLDQQAAVGVPQVVEADGRDAGVVHDPPERLVHSMGVDGLAVAVGEHPPVMGDADGGELGGLERPPPRQDRERGVVERDGPPCGLGLAAGRVDLVADGDESAVEVQALSW